MWGDRFIISPSEFFKEKGIFYSALVIQDHTVTLVTPDWIANNSNYLSTMRTEETIKEYNYNISLQWSLSATLSPDNEMHHLLAASLCILI